MNVIDSLFGGAASARPARVILFGPEKPRWWQALRAESTVWRGVPGVEEVRVTDRLRDVLRWGWAGRRQSIVVPLKKRAIRRCPPFYWGLVPNRQAHDICDDKIRFDRFMRAAGFAELLPRSWRRSADCQFPCVIKRNNKNGSYGVRVLRSPEELAAALAVRPFRGRPVIFQELVEGLVDHATHCVAVDGKLVWHCSYAYDIDPASRVQTTDVHATRRRIVAPATVLARFEQVLTALRYSGPASFDWRPRGDAPLIFEINPRFGGSLMLEINRDYLRAGLSALVAHARPPTGGGRRQG